MDPRAVEYLGAFMRGNPELSTENMIAARQAFLAPEKASAELESPQPYDDAHRELELLRAAFWTLDEGELRRRISGLRANARPMLAVEAQRLSAVAERRGAFEALAADGACAPEFTAALRAIAVAGLSGAADLRAFFLDSLDTPNKARVWRRSARRVVKAHPKLLELEAFWVRQAASPPWHRSLWERHRAAETWLVEWLCLLAAVVCITLSLLARG